MTHTNQAFASLAVINANAHFCISIDASRNRVITAPAYMYDGKPHEVFDNVGMMIDALKKMMKKTKSKKEKKK